MFSRYRAIFSFTPVHSVTSGLLCQSLLSQLWALVIYLENDRSLVDRCNVTSVYSHNVSSPCLSVTRVYCNNSTFKKRFSLESSSMPQVFAWVVNKKLYRRNRPFPPSLDNIRVMVIVWRLRGNIIRTAICAGLCDSVHSQQHIYISSSYMSNRWVCHIGTLITPCVEAVV